MHILRFKKNLMIPRITWTQSYLNIPYLLTLKRRVIFFHFFSFFLLLNKRKYIWNMENIQKYKIYVKITKKKNWIFLKINFSLKFRNKFLWQQILFLSPISFVARSILKRIFLLLHDFTGNTWCDSAIVKQSKFIYVTSWIFQDGWFKR